MGMDILAEKGFVLLFTDFLKLIEPLHLTGVQKEAIRLARQRADENYWEVDESFDQLIERIEAATSTEEVFDVLSEMLEGVDGCTELELVLIQCISRVVLPVEPSNLSVFENQWLSGYDVLVSAPVLIFDFSECFETRMTPTGDALAHSIGASEISPNEWASMSV